MTPSMTLHAGRISTAQHQSMPSNVATRAALAAGVKTAHWGEEAIRGGISAAAHEADGELEKTLDELTPSVIPAR